MSSQALPVNLTYSSVERSVKEGALESLLKSKYSTLSVIGSVVDLYNSITGGSYSTATRKTVSSHISVSLFSWGNIFIKIINSFELYISLIMLICK